MKKNNHRESLILALILLIVLAAAIFLDAKLPSYHIAIKVIKKACVYSLVAVSMNLLNGFTGLFSLGQAGFMLLGAYAYAILSIPVAKRAGVYQYFDGGIVKFSLPEVFSGIFGESVGPIVGMLLALLIGVEVIGKVPATLHTPLMSGANSIHGIVIAVVVIVAAHATSPLAWVFIFLAAVLGTMNVVGGYVVTDRMLEMFKSDKGKKKEEEAK